MILDNLSLSVKFNDYISIVGVSGSGKSTLLHILGLMDTYDSGSYFFKSQLLDPKKDHFHIRSQHIGFIFQSYNLVENLSCKDNILVPITFNNVSLDQNHFNRLINLLGIEHLLEVNVSLLSGGEKQRVAICRALLLNPELIIADEPTGNLDAANEAIVFNLFQQLHQEGKTIIVITHNESRAKEASIQFRLIEGKLHVKNF